MSAPARPLEDADVLLVGTAEWLDRFGETLRRDARARVHAVEMGEEALARYRSHAVDCVVTGHRLADGTGVEFLRAVREEATSVPILLCTAAGDERIASDAIGAGVTDYVPLSDPTDPPRDELLRRLSRAVDDARRTITRRNRARQFDAMFHDAQTATWVLSADGTLRRVNGAARAMLDREADALVGEPFWALPWWPDRDRVRSDVRQVVRRAADGTDAQRVMVRAAAGDETRTLELSVHPVRNPAGALVALVVEGVDRTEHVALHRDLRASEELHRVTLNNMTDTVLVTDEDGAFTYVCPNVHFIFGYSADEIRELGRIDELLGSDLFDRDRLAEEGVLTNVECAVTDRAGREHTLLVNVKEVDIQGGTLLYSCRDVTKRKQREDALQALHATSRKLLYAETKEEIAQVLVEDTGEILGLDGCALYLFHPADGELRPAAYSPTMADLHGPALAHRATPDSIVGHCLVENQTRFFDDVHDCDRLRNRASEVRSGAFIPLGEHGVYVAASPDVGAFDPIRRELADLAAATAEAALDRVERETELRARDRELQRRNDQLSHLNRINELIREIDRGLVQAETREEIDEALCEALTDGDQFRFAWVGEVDAVDETVRPRTWAGADRGYLDSIDLSVGSADGDPAGRTAAQGSVTLVANVAADLHSADWRKEALAREFQSVIGVPLADEQFTYGVLTVYADAPSAFDETSRAVLAELGETVASAISALERKNALLAASGPRLEFRTRDPSFALVQLARRARCSITFRGGVQRTADGVSLFAEVGDASVHDVAAVADEMVSIHELRVLTEGAGDGDRALVQLHVSQPFVALSLADRGAILRRIEAEEDGATLLVDAPGNVDARPIIEHVLEAFDGTELVAKRQDDRTSARDLYSAFLDRLTDRQLEVVQAAYYGGFFESPRDSTGEDIADALGISPPAFYRHQRTVQRKLFETLFDDVGVPAGTPD